MAFPSGKYIFEEIFFILEFIDQTNSIVSSIPWRFPHHYHQQNQVANNFKKRKIIKKKIQNQ